MSNLFFKNVVTGLTSNEDGHGNGSTQQDDSKEPADALETPGSLALLGHNQLLAPGHWTGCLELHRHTNILYAEF